MAQGFESLVLQEIIKTYQDHRKQASALRRSWIIASTIGWSVMIAAYFLSWFDLLKGPLCVVIAGLGGIAEGWSFMYLLTREQLPVLVRYTTLDTDEAQKRLDELKGTSAAQNPK